MTASPEPLETQVDRTALSWGRTAATLAVVALLFARWAGTIGPVALLPMTIGLIAAAIIGVLARIRAPARRADFASGQARPPIRGAAALCGISLLFAGTGMLAVLLSWAH